VATSQPQSAPQRMKAAPWFLGQGDRADELYHRAQRAALRECPLLISGETGSGKEVWANLTHQLGPRAARPFVPVNCAALTLSLAESQLFGHRQGAFTGATGSALGVFRAAEGGIVFLDEIGEMPLELQPKLLRVLQEQEVTPVGASTPVSVDVQVIAATNLDLKTEVAKGRFREDLFFRLNLLELKLPSLRERFDELAGFVDFFSRRYANVYGRPIWRADAETLDQFRGYHWPGNFRELAHVIEQSYVLDCAPTLPTDGDRPDGETQELPFLNLERLREEAVRQALRRTQGRKGMAAQLLGVHANTMTRILRRIPNLADLRD